MYHFLRRCKSRSDQKLSCTTSSVGENRRPTKNLVVLPPPIGEILCPNENSAVPLSLLPPFPSGKNYRPTKITVILLSPFLKIVRPTVNSVLLLVPFFYQCLSTGPYSQSALSLARCFSKIVRPTKYSALPLSPFLLNRSYEESLYFLDWREFFLEKTKAKRKEKKK